MEEDRTIPVEFEPTELREHLRNGVVTIEFRKKDGTLRELKSTLDFELIPEENRPKKSDTEKKESDSLEKGYLTVFALGDTMAWRTIRLDSIIDINYTGGPT